MAVALAIADSHSIPDEGYFVKQFTTDYLLVDETLRREYFGV